MASCLQAFRFWFKGNKTVIGVGMIPRGKVGLIFAQMGLSTGVFNQGLFAGATLMALVTTFVAPPLLKSLLSARPSRRVTEPLEGIQDLVTEACGCEDARTRGSSEMWIEAALHELIASKLSGHQIIVVANREPYLHRFAGDSIECTRRPAHGSRP